MAPLPGEDWGRTGSPSAAGLQPRHAAHTAWVLPAPSHPRPLAAWLQKGRGPGIGGWGQREVEGGAESWWGGAQGWVWGESPIRVELGRPYSHPVLGVRGRWSPPCVDRDVTPPLPGSGRGHRRPHVTLTRSVVSPRWVCSAFPGSREKPLEAPGGAVAW